MREEIKKELERRINGTKKKSGKVMITVAAGSALYLLGKQSGERKGFTNGWIDGFVSGVEAAEDIIKRKFETK